MELIQPNNEYLEVSETEERIGLFRGMLDLYKVRPTVALLNPEDFKRFIRRPAVKHRYIPGTPEGQVAYTLDDILLVPCNVCQSVVFLVSPPFNGGTQQEIVDLSHFNQ